MRFNVSLDLLVNLFLPFVFSLELAFTGDINNFYRSVRRFLFILPPNRRNATSLPATRRGVHFFRSRSSTLQGSEMLNYYVNVFKTATTFYKNCIFSSGRQFCLFIISATLSCRLSIRIVCAFRLRNDGLHIRAY